MPDDPKQPEVPENSKESPSLGTDGFAFYLDERALVREKKGTVPEVLWPDGDWHPYPDFNWYEARTLTPEQAAEEAGGEENLSKPGVGGEPATDGEAPEAKSSSS